MSDFPSIPRFEIIEPLGRNGNHNYLARHVNLGTIVRLQFVRGHIAVARLMHQAKMLSWLNHPNIAAIYELSMVGDDGMYVIRQFVEGASLADTVPDRGPMSFGEVVRILRSVVAAVECAHARQTVHGFLHPKHILLDRVGNVFVIGFGEVGPDVPGLNAIGNPHFLAPEQLDGRAKLVPQTDVYGLAELAYYLLCRQFPFGDTEEIADLLVRKNCGTSASIETHRPELPNALDRVLRRGMSVRPSHRHATPTKFVDDLERAFRLGRKWWQFWR